MDRCCPQMVGATRHPYGCFWCSGWAVNEIGIPAAWAAMNVDSMGALGAQIVEATTGPLAVLAGIAPGRARWRQEGVRFSLHENGRELLPPIDIAAAYRSALVRRLNAPHAVAVLLLGRGACRTCGVPWLDPQPAACGGCSDVRIAIVLQDLEDGE